MRQLLIAPLLCFAVLLSAQKKPAAPAMAVDSKLTPGAALLFKNVKTNATVPEKNKLFQLLDLTLAPDQMGFTMAEYDVETYVYPTDMNKDGVDELFIGFGSVALFGNVGESFALYIKDKSGAYKLAESFSGRPTILSAANLGYPDIMVGGPGFEFPVYRWNGRAYAMHRKIKDSALNNKNSTDIEEYSKSFTAKR
jgi:hypothetical protein